MQEQAVVRPLRLWQSLLFFGVPALCGVLGQYALLPFLVRLGVSRENAYNTVHLAMFLGLLGATLVALRVEGWPFTWASIVERLRFERMDAAAWKWTLAFSALYLLMGFVLNLAGQFVYQQLGFWPPDADIPLTNVPVFLAGFVVNVVTEELWWRGYILPRQEKAHGRTAWIVNGVLWSLFHAWKWWAVPFMLLKQWMIPFVAQRHKRTTPALVMHAISNGAGVLLSILPLLAD